ncbi:hypothetical protein AB0C65_36060 [Nocardia sp. NPDC048505]|uniref:hypothetical protein n=1 Tax=Nocardia sp. NPDC048505 TaxID=3155756 RepID=UPI0033D49C49
MGGEEMTPAIAMLIPLAGLTMITGILLLHIGRRVLGRILVSTLTLAMTATLVERFLARDWIAVAVWAVITVVTAVTTMIGIPKIVLPADRYAPSE